MVDDPPAIVDAVAAPAAGVIEAAAVEAIKIAGFVADPG
jgi:hypothetical protein